jgi:hypothetical protein
MLANGQLKLRLIRFSQRFRFVTEVAMRKFIIAAASAIALSFAAVPALAQHGGGGHSGGGHSGGGWSGGGGSWHGGGGGWHGGHSHVTVGFGFGYPYYWGWGYPYYGYYGYYPYAYGYPYPAAYPYGYYDDGSSSTYIQRDSGEGIAPSYPAPRGEFSAPRDQYSYYCTNPAGYFPQVNNCPSGWLTVVPNAAPHGAPAPR